MVIGTDSNYETEVIKSELPVIVDFWAEWCMPCRMIAPVLEEFANEYANKIKIVKFNVDENPYKSQELGITAIPTLLFYKNGEIFERVIGAYPKEYLKRIVDNMVD